MKIYECNQCNDNSSFLSDVINSMNIDQSKYKWIITDLDLVPIFDGDYSGIGRKASENVAYKFCKKIEQEKIAILNYCELLAVLKETRTIINGVFICLEKQNFVNFNTYRPKVESDVPQRMYDSRAKCEIRILDGELFFILEE